MTPNVTNSEVDCTLCGTAAAFWCADKQRRYFRCPNCALVMADPAAQLTPAAEKAIYDFHENDPADTRYRAFLSQLSEPLLQRLSPGMAGLDFGCGPGPTLRLMLGEAGMQMSVYDPYYYPDESALTQHYDFVTATEVVEHFNQPGEVWPLLTRLVKPGGWLAVMTAMVPGRETADFLRWSYKGDPTHVSFYSPVTIEWLGERFGFRVTMISDRVLLLQRHAAPHSAHGSIA